MLNYLVRRARRVFKGPDNDQQIYYDLCSVDVDTNEVVDRGVSLVDPNRGPQTNTYTTPTLQQFLGQDNVLRALMVWRGADNDQQIYYDLYNFNTESWQGASNITPVTYANTSPSLCSTARWPDVAADILMAFKGNGNDPQIYWKLFDTATSVWRQTQALQGPGGINLNSTTTIPSLILLPYLPNTTRRILMAYTGLYEMSRGPLCYAIYDSTNVSWSGPHLVSEALLASYIDPSLANYTALAGGRTTPNTVLLFGGGPNDPRLFYFIFDGTSWTQYDQMFDASIDSTPSTVDNGVNAFIVNKGALGDPQIYFTPVYEGTRLGPGGGVAPSIIPGTTSNTVPAIAGIGL